jgi:sugar/nucleoside kinase (ribokinase family)
LTWGGDRGTRNILDDRFTCDERLVRSVCDVLATLGDLVEDVVVHVGDPVNVASDTAARIVRRRGGSAANVAAAAARLGFPARFLGQVGVDPIGGALVADLAATGVETGFVRRGGRTGTIVVLVDPSGERTMLTDREACSELSEPDPLWLDGVSILHVPMYSLADGPMAATARTLITWAHERGVAVSIDVSSVALIVERGRAAVHRLLADLRPSLVFANAGEAEVLGIVDQVAGAVTVVKHGAAPAVVHTSRGRHEIPAESVGEVTDTTGAGDAFAAGFLTAPWATDVVGACRVAHRAAAAALRA